MLPELTHWPVNWVDGMKITRGHLLASDNAFRDLIRDVGGAMLTGLTYGLLPPLPGRENALMLTCDGFELTLTACRAITPGGQRIELNGNPAEILQLPLSSVREEWTRQGFNTGYVLVDANPFSPQPAGQPDPDEVPLRYPFTKPALRLSVVPPQALNSVMAAGFHLPVGKLNLHNGMFSLSENYLPPCRVIAAHARAQEHYQTLGSRMGEIAGYATAIIVRVKTNARSGQPNALANSIESLAKATLSPIADILDSYQLRGLWESPVYLAETGMRLARNMSLAISCIPDREKENMFNYFKNWTPITPMQVETVLQNMLDTPYLHADCQPSVFAFLELTDIVRKLYAKLSELNYLEKNKDEFFVDKQEEAPKPAVKNSFWSR